jgi:hypothetical protein
MVDRTCDNTFFKGKNDWVDGTNTAVLYPTEVKTWVLNIDSRFRDPAQSTSSTDFYIRLPRTYKNVIVLKLSSVELPNTWYAFSDKHGETSFTVNHNGSNSVVSISEGNYPHPDLLALAVKNSLVSQAGMTDASVNFSSNTGKITIENTAGTPSGFSLHFGAAVSCGSALPPESSSYRPYNGGLGYLLGFTAQNYTGNATYTGEYIVDTLRDNYVLLQLPELEMMMDSFTYGNTAIRAFAKITVDVDKNALIYVDAGDAITRAITFPQPTNIAGFRVKLVDAYGLPIDLMANFSFTLELQEVVSTKVYEAYRNNMTC